MLAPWLGHHIRLADKQGALQGGRHMGAVQAFAVELLLVSDAHTRFLDAEWDMKARLAGGNPSLIQELFSEDKKNSDDIDEVIERGELDRIEWLSPADTGIEEYERIMRQVDDLRSLSMSSSDRDEGWR